MTDPLMDALARLDPARTDAPPAPGSDRHDRILERAMTTPTATPPPADEATDLDDVGPAPVTSLDDRAPRRRRPLALMVAVAAVLVVVALAITLAGRSDEDVDVTDGSTTMTTAAAAPFDADSHKVRVTYERPEGTRTLVAEVDGTDSHKVTTAPDGSTEESTVIGDQLWEDGDPPVTVTPDMVNAPYREASTAVLAALERAESTEDLGTREVQGLQVRQLSIELGQAGIDALSALPANLTAQFELEDATSVTDLDVWVADGLIVQVILGLTPGDGDADTTIVVLEVFDLGVPNVIEPPA